MPKRIQRKRTKGWRMPAGSVYVGRPTIWGNPFTGSDAVEKFRKAVSTWPIPEEQMAAWLAAGGEEICLIIIAGRMHPAIDEIIGRDLACWCSLDKPCHADVLLEIANTPKITQK